jgi:hypothetical protein
MKKIKLLLFFISVFSFISISTLGQNICTGKIICKGGPVFDPDDIPIPCVISWLETDTCDYVLSLNSHWICGCELTVNGIDYFIDDEVIITGMVTFLGTNIYSKNIYEIEIATIEKLYNVTLYDVILIANPTVGGTVTGGGTGFTENDEITITATPNKNYIFVNWTNGNTEVSTDAEYTFTVIETVALTANFTTESGITNYNYDKITIYPNPATETLYFNKETVFEIVDLQGKILLKSEITVKSLNINFLQTGIYFMKTENSVQKFIKE